MNLDDTVIFLDVNGDAVIVSTEEIMNRVITGHFRLFGLSLKAISEIRRYLMMNNFSVYNEDKLIKELRDGRESIEN